MGYSPWHHRESDTTKHIHIQGLLGNLPFCITYTVFHHSQII